jgi:transcriptional/translational regulatory protein YebC/TACO1
MSENKGLILVDTKLISEEKLMDLALEAGAEDVVEEESEFQIHTAADGFDNVRSTLEESGLTFIDASISMIPKNTIEVTEEKTAKSLLKLMENLEDHDDVQNVYSNFDIDDAVMEQLS